MPKLRVLTYILSIALKFMTFAEDVGYRRLIWHMCYTAVSAKVRSALYNYLVELPMV